MRCTRYRRVRSRFGGTVRRCAKFSGGARKSRSSYRRKSRATGMAKRGSHCVRFKRVRVRGGGYQRRCAKFSGSGRSSYRRASTKRGKRPFNKGKKCVRMGYSRTGKRVCRSYGGRRRSGKQIYPGVPLTPRRFWLGTGR